MKIIMDKMEARSKWLKANGKARPYLGKHQRLILARAKSEVGHRPSCDDPDRVREGYEKSTIAGDDPKAFRDKYRFLPYDEVETNLRNIWAAMQREAYKNCPHDFQPYKAYAYKAAFQQYKDANTNWKDVLLAYRADKIKEWNQDHDTEDRDKEAADVNTVVVGAGEGTEIVETAPPHKRAAVGGSVWRARFLAVEKFQQQNLRLPVRNKRATKHEQRLANWLDKAKQRKHRALSSRPSERLLTPTEAAQLTKLTNVDKAHKARQRWTKRRLTVESQGDRCMRENDAWKKWKTWCVFHLSLIHI